MPVSRRAQTGSRPRHQRIHRNQILVASDGRHDRFGPNGVRPGAYPLGTGEGMGGVAIGENGPLGSEIRRERFERAGTRPGVNGHIRSIGRLSDALSQHGQRRKVSR